jgi:hypothetical protein
MIPNGAASMITVAVTSSRGMVGTVRPGMTVTCTCARASSKASVARGAVAGHRRSPTRAAALVISTAMSSCPSAARNPAMPAASSRAGKHWSEERRYAGKRRCCNTCAGPARPGARISWRRARKRSARGKAEVPQVIICRIERLPASGGYPDLGSEPRRARAVRHELIHILLAEPGHDYSLPHGGRAEGQEFARRK